jgi:hypothetical protein
MVKFDLADNSEKKQNDDFVLRRFTNYTKQVKKVVKKHSYHLRPALRKKEKSKDFATYLAQKKRKSTSGRKYRNFELREKPTTK